MVGDSVAIVTRLSLVALNVLDISYLSSNFLLASYLARAIIWYLYVFSSLKHPFARTGTSLFMHVPGIICN